MEILSKARSAVCDLLKCWNQFSLKSVIVFFRSFKLACEMCVVTFQCTLQKKKKMLLTIIDVAISLRSMLFCTLTRELFFWATLIQK